MFQTTATRRRKKKKNERYTELSKYFLSRNVPGDGLCLPRSIEALIDNPGERNYKYIAEAKKINDNRVQQVQQFIKVMEEKGLDKYINEMSNDLKDVMIGIGAGTDSEKIKELLNEDLVLNKGDDDPEKAEFSTLPLRWVRFLASIEKKKIFIFIDDGSSTHHFVFYPIGNNYPLTNKESAKYNTIEHTLFILKHGGHYYPLKIKEQEISKIDSIKDIIKDTFWEKNDYPLADYYYEINKTTANDPDPDDKHDEYLELTETEKKIKPHITGYIPPKSDGGAVLIILHLPPDTTTGKGGIIRADDILNGGLDVIVNAANSGGTGVGAGGIDVAINNHGGPAMEQERKKYMANHKKKMVEG